MDLTSKYLLNIIKIITRRRTFYAVLLYGEFVIGSSCAKNRRLHNSMKIPETNKILLWNFLCSALILIFILERLDFYEENFNIVLVFTFVFIEFCASIHQFVIHQFCLCVSIYVYIHIHLMFVLFVEKIYWALHFGLHTHTHTSLILGYGQYILEVI